MFREECVSRTSMKRMSCYLQQFSSSYKRKFLNVLVISISSSPFLCQFNISLYPLFHSLFSFLFFFTLIGILSLSYSSYIISSFRCKKIQIGCNWQDENWNERRRKRSLRNGKTRDERKTWEDWMFENILIPKTYKSALDTEMKN